MAEILKRNEAVPAAYPAAPSGLSAAATALDADAVWARVEAYVAHRWTDREVIWTVQGPGGFSPDLTPTTVTATEKWVNSAWEAVTLDPSPLGGLVLEGDAIYRVTADVGSGTVPAEVEEAWRRLAEYLAEPVGKHGVSQYSVNISDAIQESFDRSPAWMAKAMQNSGAGDLLRTFRRVQC